VRGDDVEDINVENLTETKSHRAAQAKSATKDLTRTWPPALRVSALGGLLVAAAVGWKLVARRHSKGSFGSKVQQN